MQERDLAEDLRRQIYDFCQRAAGSDKGRFILVCGVGNDRGAFLCSGDIGRTAAVGLHRLNLGRCFVAKFQRRDNGFGIGVYEVVEFHPVRHTRIRLFAAVGLLRIDHQFKLTFLDNTVHRKTRRVGTRLGNGHHRRRWPSRDDGRQRVAHIPHEAIEAGIDGIIIRCRIAKCELLVSMSNDLTAVGVKNGNAHILSTFIEAEIQHYPCRLGVAGVDEETLAFAINNALLVVLMARLHVAHEVFLLVARIAARCIVHPPGVAKPCVVLH